MQAQRSVLSGDDVEFARREIRAKWTKTERVERLDAAKRRQRMLLWLVTMNGVHHGAARQLRHIHLAS